MNKLILNITYFFISILLFNTITYSQDTTVQKTDTSKIIEIGKTRYSPNYTIENGDTIPTVFIQEFEYKDPDFAREWNRTVYFARRMYTYAEIIDSIIKQLDKEKEAEKNNSWRKKRKIKRQNKKVKKDLFKEYKYEIKNLTNIRGDYLTKLIYRKTGFTTYELIKKYKSGRTAWFYNSILYMYGSTNLKNKYDPKKDWMLKLVLQDIESGKITPISRLQQVYELKAREARAKERKKRKKEKKK